MILLHCLISKTPTLVEKSGTYLIYKRNYSQFYVQTANVSCSEISCNVKLNVYLAMEIPDRVSFVSGQNSDEIVRSCELS